MAGEIDLGFTEGSSRKCSRWTVGPAESRDMGFGICNSELSYNMWSLFDTSSSLF